jgi:phosphoglucomutase/phosphopentomutase
MGNRAYNLKKEGKTVLFAFEEAIGFMFGDLVLDKDGVSAAVRMAEMLVNLDKQKLTLNQQLTKIYDT